MRFIQVKKLRPARYLGPAILLLLAASLGSASFSTQARAEPPGDHAAAVAALSDLNAAISEILHANDSYATDRNVFHRASQRAINALEGSSGAEYKPAAGTPGDSLGALGHLDALLHRKGTPVWESPLDSVEANIQAAVAHLLDANKAHDLMVFALATSRALAYLEVARGRPTEFGALGGMEGTLANTALGVPAGATVEDGCSSPSAASTSAPAYGVHGGYIAWVALPASEGTYAFAENPGGRSVIVKQGLIILPTAAAALVARACHTHAAVAPPQPSPQIRRAAATPPKPAAKAARTNVPALYTSTQATSGARVFAVKCVACHGGDMQGTAAPAVAGTEFLKTAKQNGWTLEVMRELVVNNMPFNAPGSLSPTEYANVLAFLLASDCYPAGNTPFPISDNPAFANIKLGPVPGQQSRQNNYGVCPPTG